MPTAQQYQTITTLRHDMHVFDLPNDKNYDLMIDQIEDTCRELGEQPPAMQRLHLEDIECPAECEEICEGCVECLELECEKLAAVKHNNNTAIEQWLTAQEKKHNMDENEIAPTGIARTDWIISI